MAASMRSALSVDIDGKRSTKGAGKETRLPNLDNDFIITTRVQKGLKQWKFLQTKVSEKEKKVAKGRHCKHLEQYKQERDELVEQVRADLPKLQSIFYDEYSNAFDRKDKRRTTTGDMRKENRENPSLRSAESEINQMKSQLEQEMKSKDEALSSLRSAKSDINQLKSDLENERKSKAEDILRLEAKTNHLTNQLENERKAKEDALLRLTKSFDEREKELKKRCDELTTELARSEKKLKEEERENKTVKYRLEDEKRRTEEELKRREAKTNQLTNQLDNERKAKEDALLRLRSMASNKLRDNNPNIDYLSDPNRPTKLSEQFSELYDNEWTDAFDELEKLLGDKEEKKIISYLRDFVLEIHSVCSDLSFSKMKTIEEAFVKPSLPSENTKIPTEIFKTIKDGIKSMAPKLLEATRELVLGHLKEKYLEDAIAGCLQHENVKRYINRCTEVCWYMSVQDPQLVMDGNKSPDDTFDSNKHREYNKKGPYEEFVVWPVLYLYKGGQMLSKGVAQGAKKDMIGQQ